MTRNARWLWLAVAATALNGSACSPTPLEVGAGAASAVTTANEPPQQTTDDQQAEEIWMVCRSGDARVGYTHTRVEPVDDNGAKRLQFSYEDQLTMKRFQDTTVVSTKLSSLETMDGRIIRFRTEMKTGPGAIVTEGRLEDGNLAMQTKAAGKAEKHTIPWDSQWGGFFADQQSLRNRPMKPGETRSLKALLPILNQMGEIRMKAVGNEAVSLLSGSRQLLRIDITHDLGAAQLKTKFWTDETGRAWKMRDLQLGLEFYRTTQQVALAEGGGAAFDLGSDIVIKVDRRLAAPHQTRRIVYRARLTDGDVRSLFAAGPSQSVKPIDDHTAEVIVQAIRPDTPKKVNVPKEDRPTEADSASSAMIQSDDTLVTTMARTVAADQTDPWNIACALERHVRAKIRLKNYSTAMATAAAVAKTLEGDCTEHAMLLAALCRARKIPARVAIGMVYYSADQAYAYHMWTEVWIEDRWIPMDATLGRGGIGAAHVKFSHSSMHGASALAELLPVIQAIGRLELEVVEVE